MGQGASVGVASGSPSRKDDRVPESAPAAPAAEGVASPPNERTAEARASSSPGAPVRKGSSFGFSLRKSAAGGKDRKSSGGSARGSLLGMKLRHSSGAGNAAAAADESKRRVDELFDRYRLVTEEAEDEEELDSDSMGPNGLAALLADVGVPEDDVLAFVVAWKLGCSHVSCMTRAEFHAGLRGLGCDTVAALRALLPRLEDELRQHGRDVALYAFKISRPPGSKTLDLASARILIELFLPPARHEHTAPFVAWLLSPEQASYRALNLDQFGQFYDFAKAGVKADLSNFDDDDGWPCIIDEYVEHVRNRPSSSNERLADGVSGSSPSM